MSVVFSILLRIKFCILDKQIINKGELKMNVENILRENIITGLHKDSYYRDDKQKR